MSNRQPLPQFILCEHRHTREEHPSCFKSGKSWWADKKIGYLDIEASNLKADFGMILSWYIKERGKAVYHHDTIQVPNPTKNHDHLDKPQVASVVETIKKFDIMVTYYGCVTPDQHILTSDLRWVEAGKLAKGDSLLAFDEEPTLGRRRKWVESVVLENKRMGMEVFEITLKDGSVLKATGEHPWLVKGYSGYSWKTTNQLIGALKHSHTAPEGVRLPRLMRVPKERTYEMGWLAAFFDSEGSLAQSLIKGFTEHHGFSIAASQNLGNGVMEQAQKYMTSLEFNHSSSKYDPSNPKIGSVYIVGSSADKIEFLAYVRPERLINRLDINKLGALRKKSNVGIPIESIKSIGEQEIVALGTTSKTYISEGFGSHNSLFDIPFIKSRAFHYGLDFPTYGSIIQWDLYFLARGNFALTSRRQNSLAEMMFGKSEKTRLHGDLWNHAVRGSASALKYVADHNRRDVRELEKLHTALMPYIKPTRRSL